MRGTLVLAVPVAGLPVLVSHPGGYGHPEVAPSPVDRQTALIRGLVGLEAMNWIGLAGVQVALAKRIFNDRMGGFVSRTHGRRVPLRHMVKSTQSRRKRE